ncbi:phosphotransferase family protein [Ferrovibrio terrae]|uniref:Phosphotransferase family protein n=1 Tax=Ferrovibrio terrae TaxID=2594003 RepID=A0A516GYI2_9PROT|nr:phosphotransferase family protein [Ferrovibrio terrae]QDO96400.1 phosphotransferase family protein [Ferrovibrio terrae]
MVWDWTSETQERISEFLVTRDLLKGVSQLQRIGDGHSNLTYVLRHDAQAVVLRRPPPPPQPKGAHDVLREARILAALEGSGLPVPRILATASAGEVLDVPFYIMEWLPGVVITDTLPPSLGSPDLRRPMAEVFVDTLVDLHAVDWRSRGLSDFGRPEGFNARHLGRIEALLRSRRGPVPADFLEMLDWLQKHCPSESDGTIVHNDYRLGNVMWHSEAPPRLLAILDWELATIGDPLLDLGYMAVCYPEQDESLTPNQELSAAFLQPGFPTRAEIFRRYAARSGRDLTELHWYAAMAAWKMAVLYDFSHQKGHDPFYADPQQSNRFLAAGKRFAKLGPSGLL